jgi:hypothetical protein
MPATTTASPAVPPSTPVSALATGPGSTTTLASAQSGTALYRQADQDALREGWFHAEENTTEGEASSTISQDSGLSSGHQSVTQSGGHLEVIIVGTALYVKADAAGMTEALGVTSAEAARYANVWISVPPSDGLYASAAEGVTVFSALNEVALSGPISVGAPTEVNGIEVVGLHGEGPGPNGGGTVPETIFVSTGADPLPVEVNETASDGSTLKATFSQWGVPVAIAPPSGSIPIGSIPGAP